MNKIKNITLDNNKYALVLSGGGAKGAYQIGVWQALRELKIQFSAIIGTSVGALNGALIAQDDYEIAVKLWNNLNLEQIIQFPHELKENDIVDSLKKYFSTIKDFAKTTLKNKGLDTSNLEKLLKKHLNEKKIRKNNIDLGLVTFQLDKLQPLEIFIEEIPDGLLFKYLLASSAIPIIFKSIKIDNHQLIDGAVYDNTPYNLIKERGYKNIIVVDMSAMAINKKPSTNNTKTIYIKNSMKLGNILDFSQTSIQYSKRLGYLDTLKVFGKINGIKYFYNYNAKILSKLESLLFDKDIVFQYSKYLDYNDKLSTEKDILKTIKKNLPKNNRHYYNVIIPLLECSALSLNIEINKQYKLKELLMIISEKYIKIKESNINEEAKHYLHFFSKIEAFQKNNEIETNIFKHPPYAYVIAFKQLKIFKKLKIDNNTFLKFFPQLTSAQIFFVLLDNYFNHK